MKISSIGWLLLTFNGKNLKNVINCQATAVIKKMKCSLSSFRVALGQEYRALAGGFLLLRIFSVAISVRSHVCFIVNLILIAMFLR